MLDKNQVAEFISTFGYIGKIKYCPGTFGSLAAYPLCYIIMYFTITNQIVFSFSKLNVIEEQFITIFFICTAIAFLLFVIGVYYSSIYAKYIRKDDPKEVVIDEVVGQMLVITFSVFSVAFAHHSNLRSYLRSEIIDFIFIFVLPFGLFRLFDIFKPWPINWLDKNIKGGIGIMLDDLLAAVFAVIAHYAITFTIIDWFEPSSKV